MSQSLRKKLDIILKNDNVVSNDSVISAYDLLNALEFVLGDVFKLLKKDKYMEVFNKTNIKKNLYYLIMNNILDKVLVLYFFITITGDNLSLKFISRVKKRTIVFTISKLLNEEEFYYNFIGRTNEKDKELVKEFISDNLDTINEMFFIIENFYNTFGVKIKNSQIMDVNLTQRITNNFLNIDIDLTQNYLGYDFSLCEGVVNDVNFWNQIIFNKIKILKKTSIDVDELNNFYKKVVLFYNEKNKVKCLNI